MAKKTTFPIPAGYQLPENVKEGQTFDESCTLKLEGGRLCVTAINGISLPGYEEKNDEGRKAEPPAGGDAPPPDFMSRYNAAMGG